MTGRNEEKLQALAARLTDQGYAAETELVDASQPEAMRGLIAKLVESHGAIEVAHYNAASLRKATISDQ